MSNDCAICCSSFNLTTRKLVNCPYCTFSACRACCETYVLGESTVRCMNNDCAREWTRQHIVSVFTGTFINGKLKKHREDLLYDNERALLPATQPIVERAIAFENITAQQREIREQIRELRIRSGQLNIQFYNMNNQPVAAQRAEFVRACPDGECRGFLSTQWKCGLCQKWACPDCHEVKGLQRDVEHVCNPDVLATARLLANDTRPCPSCRTGIFKIDGCFAKDTPVLMWDGTTKMSQDICMSDVLVGDNGEQRMVEHLVSGEDDLYKIKQKNGVAYTVNSKHTLALKFTGEVSPKWMESIQSYKIMWFDTAFNKIKTKQFKVTENCDKSQARLVAEEYVKTLTIDDVILITVDEYIKLDDWSKKNLFGYKTPSGINYPCEDVSLDPYLLGLWLGDGTHSRPEIASNDPEIQEYIHSWCCAHDAELIQDTQYKFRIRRKGYTYGKETVDGVVYDEQQEVLDKTNPFTNLLKQYNLLSNKHIPASYMMNSRDVRLQVLAGIIDTDGHVPLDQNGKRVVIIQTHETLSRQIILLAQSLGFIVNCIIRERKDAVIFGLEKKDYKNQFVINISGELLHEIPTILPRKKCVGTKSNKDYLRTGIQVDYVGKGQYYGWSVNDNSRFLLEDFTVVKNCDQMWCTQCHTAFNWRTGRVEQVVHNPHYFEWLRRNGTAIPRNPGDIPCQNALTHQTFTGIRTLLQTRHRTHAFSVVCENMLSKIVRNTLHLAHAVLPMFREQNRVQRNEFLRIQYMRKLISAEQFKVTLQRNDKKAEKNREIYNILDVLRNTMTDIVFRFYSHLETCPHGGWSLDIFDEIDPIVDYTNDCLHEISRTYKCKRMLFNNEIVQKL